MEPEQGAGPFASRDAPSAIEVHERGRHHGENRLAAERALSDPRAIARLEAAESGIMVDDLLQQIGAGIVPRVVGARIVQTNDKKVVGLVNESLAL